MRALSTRTLKPSLGNSFVTEWVSSAGATPVSHSQLLETEKAKTTQDISGLGSKTELPLCDQASVSLRMSTDISRWDSPQSSATWKNLVTKRRGEFSRRLKSALHTNASESSSWPTASTRDHKGGYSGGRIRTGKVSMDTLDVAVQAYSEGGLLAQDNPNIDGSRPESWATPSAYDWNQPETKEQWEKRAATQAEKGVNLHLPLKSQAIQVGNDISWPTPRTSDAEGGPIKTEMTDTGFRSVREKSNQFFGAKLRDAVETHENWPTPRAGLPGSRKEGTGGKVLEEEARKHGNWATPNAGDFKAGISTGRKQKSLGQDVTNSLANWATPNTLDHMELRSPEALLRQATTTRAGRTAPANLREQVDPTSVEIYKQANWPTPTSMEAGKIGNQPNFGQTGLSNHPSIVGVPTREKAEKSDSTAQQKQKITHKLNPRFVETLMGLPIGWVMPNCAQPISTAITSYAPSGTASCHPNAPMLIELSSVS